MNSWKKILLYEVADVKLSNVDKTTNPDEIKVKLCNYTDVYKNAFINSKKAKNFMVATCSEKELDNFKLKKGQVAITKDSETRDDIGISTYISEDFDDVVLGYHTSLITPNESLLNGRFLYYWFNTRFAKKYFENNSGGSGQRYTLPLDIIKSIPLHLPDLKTQQKIAFFLFTLDSKIELNHSINTELDSMAKTLYDYWFVQFDFPNKKGKPYKSSKGKMIRNEELKREIPEGWDVGTLLDIAEYTNGLPCQKYRPTTNEFLRVIKIKEMHEGFSSGTELVRPDIPQKAIIENGDVLFSWSASLEVQIWSKGKGALNQHIFKVTSDKYPKSFYYFQLVNYLQHFKMMAENRKTTMGHITQEHLEQSRIVIPPDELTMKLEEIIAPMFEKMINNEIENQKLSELRDWLLPMLMNGQVKVK